MHGGMRWGRWKVLVGFLCRVGSVERPERVASPHGSVTCTRREGDLLSTGINDTRAP